MALLSEIGVGVEFVTLITERHGVKISDYSHKHGGTWVRLRGSRRNGYTYSKETKAVHNMLVKIVG